MKKQTLLIFLFSFISGYTFGQDEMDEIFDDGTTSDKIVISVGTDIVTLLGGTLNVFGELQYNNRIALQISGGVLPFGFLTDFYGAQGLSEGKEDVKIGAFYDVGFKLLRKRSGFFKWYYYGSLKNWNYRLKMEPSSSIETDELKRKKMKFNFGGGFSFVPFEKIGFDIHTGLFIGARAESANLFDDPSLFNGLDFGIGAFYKF